MSTKKLALAVICLLGLNLLAPSLIHAEDSVTSGSDYEYQLFQTQDDNSLLDSTSTDNTLTTDLTEEEATAIAGFMALFTGVFLIISIVMGIVMYVYYGLAFSKIAEKLNVPSPWMAWVPFANMVLFARCAGFRAWTAILFFIPFVNFIYSIYGFMKVAERRGFSNLLGLLMLVPVANLVVPGYLAWAEPKKAEAAA